MTPAAIARRRASARSYAARWRAQHRAEAEIMVARGWRWSVGLYCWVPAK